MALGLPFWPASVRNGASSILIREPDIIPAVDSPVIAETVQPLSPRINCKISATWRLAGRYSLLVPGGQQHRALPSSRYDHPQACLTLPDGSVAV